MSSPFAHRRGGLELRVGEAEAELLGQITGELRGIVESPDRPAHARRLFPPAYPEDAEAQTEFAGLTGDDLAAEKLAAIDTVERAVGGARAKKGVVVITIDADETNAWLGVLNDARLALGTRLDVTEESEERPLDENEPNAFALSVYRWLGWLESHLVDELLDAMPTSLK